MSVTAAVAITHGTRKGYLWERSRGLPTCSDCRAANRRDSQRHWEARKRSEAEGVVTRIDSRQAPQPTATLTPDQAALAECAQHPNSDLWFSDDDLDIREALLICRSCPIATECLQVAMTNEAGHSDRARHGILGGLRPHQRAQLARKATA